MKKDAEKLLHKYTSGNCTPEEQALVEQWYTQFPFEGKTPSHESIEASKNDVWLSIAKRKKDPKIILFKRLSIAASIVLCFSFGLYFLSRTENNPFAAKKELKDILPGGNKAVLTLADGTVINLDDAKNGQIANQNGIIIKKLTNGQLEYILKDIPENAGKTGSNLISTPRGGQYQVTLPDGTKVWLNAASSLKYPYAFAKNERIVELSGEAYFEVSKDKMRPFKVKSNSQTIEVLGTHFNVNAYSDEESVKTTLLEGAVKVLSAAGNAMLHPGEQSILSLEGTKIVVDKNIDTDKELAWKNNLFSFDNDDLKTIMRQMSRWYDVDIVFKGNIKNEKYVGDIPRNSNLSEVFKILELNHVHIDAKGKVLTVSGN